MRDADLRRVLAAQTDWPVTHLPMTVVSQGPEAVRAALAALPPSMVIADAISGADLITLGAAAKDRKLLTGGSGIALGLPANFGATPGTPDWTAVTGPGVVLSGSCSRATRGQVAKYAAIAPAREITAKEVMDGTVSRADLVAWAMEQKVPPLLYTSADPADVRAAQDLYGTDRIAHAIEALFADLAAALADAGVRRMIVAGGETSGAVVSGLSAHRLVIGPRLATGVPALMVEGRDLALALKSGNFGGPDFFAEALSLMETA
jgi:uncharacterized protein YgbK (DUF1537 family)